MDLLMENAGVKMDCTMKIVPPLQPGELSQEEVNIVDSHCEANDVLDQEEEEACSLESRSPLDQRRRRTEVTNMESEKQSWRSPEDNDVIGHGNSQGIALVCQEDEEDHEDQEEEEDHEDQEEDHEDQLDASNREDSTQPIFGNGLLRSYKYRFTGYGWLDKITSMELLEAVERTADNTPRTRHFIQWQLNTEKKMMQEVFWCLEGYPRQWYQSESLKPTWKDLRWVSFKEMFNLYFYIPPIRMSHPFDIHDLKQGTDETVQHFHNRVCWVYDHLTHRGKINSPTAQHPSLHQAKDFHPYLNLEGMPEQLRDHICTNLFIAGLRDNIKEETGRRCQPQQPLSYYVNFARTVENMINISQKEEEEIGHDVLSTEETEASFNADLGHFEDEEEEEEEEEDGSEEEEESVSESKTRNAMSKENGEM